MPDEFSYDVFLSHSKKDRTVVRDVAERLRKDGLRVWFDEWEIRPGDSIPAKIEEGLERSRVLVLCMSANAFGSDWAQLESGTFRFRDPLNKERRFLPLRLDEAPIKGSLAQFLYINWLPGQRIQEYPKLLNACAQRMSHVALEQSDVPFRALKTLHGNPQFWDFAFSNDSKSVLTCDSTHSVKLWDVETGACLATLYFAKDPARHLLWVNKNKLLIRTVAGTTKLIDIQRHAVSDFGVKKLSKRQMLCFRLLGTGFSGSEIEKMLRIHHLTFSSHLLTIRQKLALPTNRDVRKFAAAYYGKFSPFEFGFNSRWHQRAQALAWIRELHHISDGKYDNENALRLCDDVDERAEPSFWTMAWSSNMSTLVRGWPNGLIYVWHEYTQLTLLEGHTAAVNKVVMHPTGRFVLSCSNDCTARLWDLEQRRCIAIVSRSRNPVISVHWCHDGTHALFADAEGLIRRVDLASLIAEVISGKDDAESEPALDQVQYTNAKVLLVGDTHAGKTGLTHRLATGEWKPSEDSTVGAWSTQWPVRDVRAAAGVDREIWLWDFGGQADQRLIHQLYMDRAALVLLLFNADQEDVLPGLRDWQTALRRCLKDQIPHFLVAGRIDTGFKASRGKLQAFATEQRLGYHETSAKEGDGCDELREAIIAGIPWPQMEKRTSPRIFKLIKDEVLKLRDEGQVLHTFKELRELLWRRLPDEPRFTDDTLQTVIGLLDGPGVVKELDYGSYILLAPEWINAYAQAVIRTLRSAENDLGVLPLRSIAEGKLIYQSIGRDGAPVAMKRLPAAEERVVLSEMEWQLEQRGLCLRQDGKLVFPSHCGRDRPALLEHPSVFVSYAVKGFLDDIYATLVAKLADCQSFTLKELWRDAADFVTLADDHHMGIKLTRETASDGDISVYFGKGVTQQEQVIFANYIHAHLEVTCENALRLRHYVCPKCHTAKGNPQVLMERLLADKQGADTECDKCRRRFPLWDALEKKFASDAVRRQVEELQADDLVKLTDRRKGKLLVLDVGARITSANQKWMEVPGDEDDGIDMLVEFTDEDGNGIGKGLCLQLKAGNSHLTKRKDGTEIFTIKKQRWVKTWTNQPHPVMLVIGTFPEEDGRATGSAKQEFADVRWMEITSVLQLESANGTKPVKQIEFKGERLDMSSVRKWREKVIAAKTITRG